jgi:oligosaccharide repeat unit polymerase
MIKFSTIDSLIKILLNIVSGIIFKLSLDWANYTVICPNFGAFTFPLDFNMSKYIESFVLLIIVILFIPTNNKISSIIIWLFVIISYIPCLTLYGLNNQNRYWIYANTLFWIISLLISYLFSRFLPISKLHIKVSRMRLMNFLNLISLYTFLAVITTPNLRFTVDFVEIYDVRSAFKPIFPMSAYFITWSYCFINPLMIIISNIYRKKNWLICFIFLQLLLFVTTGQKVVLFSLPFILGLNWLRKGNKINFSILSVLFAGLVILCSLSWIFLQDIWMSSTISSRLFLLPAMISYRYYEFFSENPPTYLGHSIFSGLVAYPYDDLPWYVIGMTYWDHHMSANTGLIADAYMNFRETGLIIIVTLFSLSLSIVDGIAKNRDPRLVLACVLMGYYWSTNGSFFSSILSAGLIFSIPLLFALPKIDKKVSS